MSTRPSFLLALVFVAAVVVSGVSREDVLQGSGLRGSWIETFEYHRGPYSTPQVWFDVVGYEPPTEYRTITLSFVDSSFALQVDPPEYNLHSSEARGSVSGDYSTSGNELLFRRNGGTGWERFEYCVWADSLWISAVFDTADSSFTVVPGSLWLWANSMGKNSGAFKRLVEE